MTVATVAVRPDSQIEKWVEELGPKLGGTTKLAEVVRDDKGGPKKIIIKVKVEDFVKFAESMKAEGHTGQEDGRHALEDSRKVSEGDLEHDDGKAPKPAAIAPKAPTVQTGC